MKTAPFKRSLAGSLPKRLILASALTLLPSLSWALPTPKDVTEQMAAGNVAQAEALTREILKERPDSAKAHYYLGQILTTEGNYKDAYAELSRAAQLDKSLSFASSEARFRGEMRKVEVNLGKVSAPQATNESHAGRTLLIFLAVIAGGAGIAWGIASWFARRERAEREAERQTQLAGQNTRIMALLEKASSLEVVAKLSDDPRPKLAALAGVKDELNELLARGRKQRELLSESTIRRIERSLRQIEAGRPDTQASSPITSIVATQSPPTVSKWGGVSSSPSAPSTGVTNTYVSGGSNGGLVEGLVLGELLSGGRESRSERTVERTRDEDRSDSDDSRSRFDFGGSSSFDSGSSSSFDSGSSSFDSGSSGDW